MQVTRTGNNTGVTMRPGLLLFALALAGCAGPGIEGTPSPSIGSFSASPSKAAASDLPAHGEDALTGVLGADSIEGGCPYLETQDGTRYEVIYPTGWEIDRASGALRDPTGAVVAGPGDVVTVRGRQA
ncbi:MAG: hypothetical protein ACRDGH_07280, partial [Candidatus Limnocylindria bacterium]